jgi:hypothetical protein
MRTFLSWLLIIFAPLFAMWLAWNGWNLEPINTWLDRHTILCGLVMVFGAIFGLAYILEKVERWFKELR